MDSVNPRTVSGSPSIERDASFSVADAAVPVSLATAPQRDLFLPGKPQC